MNDTIRRLCAELAQQLDNALNFTVSSDTRRRMKALVDRANAVLAQPEPVGATDEEQWYSCCPEEGIELHCSKQAAQKAAQEVMGDYAKSAHSDGWHEGMGQVSWGLLLPMEQAQIVERIEPPADSEFDEWVRYELRPARAVLQRWGGTIPQSAPSEVTDEALIAAARTAVEAFPRVSELPYFMDPVSSEYEPMLLALRAAVALGQCPTPRNE